MRFFKGQEVVILNTEGKPAGKAIIVSYLPVTNKYQVDFKYPNSSQTETIEVPEERIVTNMSSSTLSA